MSTPPDRRSKDVCILTVVIAELKLGNMQRKLLFADVVECADNAAFEDRPETLNRVRVNRADDIVTARMVDSDLLRKFFVQVFVTDPSMRCRLVYRRAIPIRYNSKSQCSLTTGWLQLLCSSLRISLKPAFW